MPNEVGRRRRRRGIVEKMMAPTTTNIGSQRHHQSDHQYLQWPSCVHHSTPRHSRQAFTAVNWEQLPPALTPLAELSGKLQVTQALEKKSKKTSLRVPLALTHLFFVCLLAGPHQCRLEKNSLSTLHK